MATTETAKCSVAGCFNPPEYVVPNPAGGLLHRCPDHRFRAEQTATPARPAEHWGQACVHGHVCGGCHKPWPCPDAKDYPPTPARPDGAGALLPRDTCPCGHINLMHAGDVLPGRRAMPCIAYGCDCKEYMSWGSRHARGYAAGAAAERGLFARIGDWQRVTFPHATTASVMAHLRREFAELEAAPTDVEEMADMVHLLVALASAAGGDLEAATRAKFARNQQREWGEPDAEGVVEHRRAALAGEGGA